MVSYLDCFYSSQIYHPKQDIGQNYSEISRCVALHALSYCGL